MARESLLAGASKFMKAAGLLSRKKCIQAHRNFAFNFRKFMAYDPSRDIDLEYDETFYCLVAKRCLYLG